MRAAVERLITSLVAEDISTITLYAEPKVVGLYEKLGFQKDPQGIKANCLNICYPTMILCVSRLCLSYP